MRYITEEFRRINGADFDIKITDNVAGSDAESVIYYGNGPSDKPSIPEFSSVKPPVTIRYISEKIFIINGTGQTYDDKRFPYDIFWNAFVFLSRLEEQSKNNINSYRARHPRVDKKSFEIPIVNHLFGELENFIKNHFPQLSFKKKQKPVLELSHDIDYIKKTLQLRLKQTAFNLYKIIMNLDNFISLSKNAASFLFSNPSYMCFDYWENLEKKYDMRSVFYVYACAGKKNPVTWILDPSYDLEKDKALQNRLKRLLDKGFEIGLHGGFESAANESVLVREKNVLEKITGKKTTKIRQHWLRYGERATPYLHHKHFDFDSTMGWNDAIGFRSGCASRYRPYDHINEKPFNHTITPLIVMDSHIFDYGVGNIPQASQEAVSMIGKVKKIKTAHVSISWHQRVCAEDYNWQGLYEELINEWVGR